MDDIAMRFSWAQYALTIGILHLGSVVSKFLDSPIRYHEKSQTALHFQKLLDDNVRANGKGFPDCALSRPHSRVCLAYI